MLAASYDRHLFFLFLLAEGNICSCIGSDLLPESITPDDEDVFEEENLVKQQAREGIDDPNAAVQIRGLVKTYPKTMKIGCCRCRETPPYHAIKVRISLTFNFFCMLRKRSKGSDTCTPLNAHRLSTPPNMWIFVNVNVQIRWCVHTVVCNNI